MEATGSTPGDRGIACSSFVIWVGGAQEGCPSSIRSFEIKKPGGSFEDFDVDCVPLAFAGSFANFPGTCCADIVGDAGRPRLWPPGMPLADAKLLAIEDDNSRAVARAPPASLGGCCNASGLVRYLDVSSGVGSDSFSAGLTLFALSTLSSFPKDCGCS